MKFAVAIAVHSAAAVVSAITIASVVVESSAPVTSPGYPICQVCDDGMVVTIPDTILDLFGDPLSCEEWQLAGLEGSVDPNDCQYLRFFTTQADVCGCAMESFAPATSPVLGTSAQVAIDDPPGPPFPVTSPGYYPIRHPPCQVCGDGMIVTVPEAILDVFGVLQDCRFWYHQGFFGYLNPNDCQYLRSQADVCGCAIDNTVCTLCENGGDDFIPDRLDFFGRDTCADIAVSTKADEWLNSAEGFRECQLKQATIGEYCGCSNPTARSKFRGCPLCGRNTPLPDPTRQVGSRQTCASIEYDRSRSSLSIFCIYDEYVREYCCAAEPYPCLFTPCENGASPLYPDAEVGLFGLTCGDVQGFIQETALLQGDANCELLRIPGLENCGCPPCTLCEDGTDLFDPSLQLNSHYCAQAALLHATDTPELCSFFQATDGEQCGCNNPIARAKIGCEVCGPGTTLPDPTRMLNSWTSCADVEYQQKLLCFRGASCCGDEVDFCCAVTFQSLAPAPFAPVTSDPPGTSAPVTSPGYPPCQVCGVGKIVTIPDGTVSPPGSDSLSCEAFQIEGLTGYINPEGCPIAYVFMSECGCAIDNLVPATPAPVTTNAPVTAAPTAVKKYPKGFCFSGETTVAVKRKGSILMKHLQIGDEVLTTSGNYEQVYSFGHRLETTKAEFLQLLPSGLEMSRDHMVLVKGRFVPASLVQVGDLLESAGGNFVTVDSIERVIRNGVYAPFTTSGTIVVSNIKASTYVAFQDTDCLHIGSWASPLTFQWVAHVSQSPHRLITRLGWAGAEQYTEDGKSVWIAGPHNFAEWLLEQNGMVMGAVLVPTLGLGLLSMAMEGLVSWFDSSSQSSSLV
jgi:Hint module